MKTSISDEQFFSNLLHLPKPSYPFPDFIHPDIQEQREEYYKWIDTEYIIHSKEAREKHKKHNLTDIAARGCPFLKSLVELRPLANYTANGAMMDDYFDRCSREEMYIIMDKIIELVSGAVSKEPEEPGIFHLFWQLRQDALGCAIPEHIYNRFIKSMKDVFIGYAEEKVYYRTNTIPPLSIYLLIREETSGVKPYCDYVALQKDYRELPDEIFDHPFIRRLYTLASLMIGIHNDIISLPKELNREGDTMNLVKVLQQEKDISLKEAYMGALDVHDAYLNEFLLLQNNLSFFGEYQDLVSNYVHDLGVMIAGVYAWHTNDKSRYINNGYVEGEYVSKG